MAIGAQKLKLKVNSEKSAVARPWERKFLGFSFTHRYNSVKRFVRLLKRHDPEQYDRLEFLMGEEAQVDYGQGAPTLHSNGKYRRPRLFIMTLKYSGRAFRKVVW